MLLGTTLAGTALLVALAVLSSRGSTVAGGASTSPTAFDLPALHGPDRVTLAEYRGTPVVVNFFASWCTACDFELPGFAKVSAEHRGRITFLGVNALETGDPDLMPTRHGITWWPLARDVGGSNGSGLHQALGGGNSMPLTAFYDADGRLLGVDRGALPEAALRERIARLYNL
jgi:cytochrome c biogenesis protein CcmG/thiol:disulfide interchange protein DsbE